jgi:hypothetical protein
MKQFLIVLIILLVAVSVWKSFELIPAYQAMKEYKEDKAEINKINYGLFNIKIWKEQALKVFENRIGEFEISPKAYDQVESELEKYLRGINKDYIESGKVFNKIFEDAEKNPSINKVFLKLIKDNAVPQIKKLDIPKHIPSLAVQLAKELKKQEPQLRDVMRNELKKILHDNDSFTYTDPREKIYQKYSQKDLTSTNGKLNVLIDNSKQKTDELIRIIYFCLMAGFILALLFTSTLGIVPSVTLMTIVSIIFLVLGVNLPMIDIEALLNSFSINVLGTDLGFQKQYMYFQSKSILDVTESMIRSKGLDLKVVGCMVLCFSVIFPFIKLVLTIFYLYSIRLRNSKWVQNIIFYLGKWSMADVFVVAMFMAYIGFYGIVTSQLGDIENNKGGFAVETLNNSSLSPGALFFTTYCIMSIVLGIMVNKKVNG